MKKQINLLALAAILCLCLNSCKKSPEVGTEVPDPNPPVSTAVVTVKEGDFTYTSDYPYNLNLVYFVPADFPEVPDYHRRVSEYMLHMRAFTAKWMKHWGYGDRTFGLLTDVAKQRVRITLIRGKLLKKDYPYEGGGSKIKTEIDAYYAANPDQKTSDHYFVLVPNDLINDNRDSPFYGMGRYAYALDSEGIEVKNMGKPGPAGAYAQWIGGLFHELGHGLNLPHSKGPESEANDTNFGMELMSSGNSTYGSSPTYLSAFSTAILNKSQIFSKEKITFYGPVTAKITKITGKYSAGNMIISGKFSSTVPVSDVILRFQRPSVDAGGYQAEGIRTKIIQTDSFYVSIPVSDIKVKDNTPYSLQAILVHQNGVLTWSENPVQFVNGIPKFHFSSEKDEFSKTPWKVTAVTSQENGGEGPNNGLGIHMIDNDLSTVWHTRWTGSNPPALPHSVTVDMGKENLTKGFSMVQRSGSMSSMSKEIEISVSSDGTTWESVLNITMAQNNYFQYFDLPAAKTFRYFKITAKSAYTPNPANASIAEVGAY
ncbi:F5/8 type C domain-containing protein [Pedobacter steynii]|uniref:F5/8 type C domain-containing protein n=1 Tax=Pedobacter steynii TaxID=430522 RepID=A0A1G9Z584_9SPHI|nr:discoidin domain-containing protein [Pedobacter steynii]NQX39934.1 discoidin domain-containing protein [Pedobacter steynii]SDN15901.1 F5/8 type C domain-containing protein [Pedobacter steynii]